MAFHGCVARCTPARRSEANLRASCERARCALACCVCLAGPVAERHGPCVCRALWMAETRGLDGQRERRLAPLLHVHSINCALVTPSKHSGDVHVRWAADAHCLRCCRSGELFRDRGESQLRQRLRDVPPFRIHVVPAGPSTVLCSPYLWLLHSAAKSAQTLSHSCLRGQVCGCCVLCDRHDELGRIRGPAPKYGSCPSLHDRRQSAQPAGSDSAPSPSCSWCVCSVQSRRTRD